jgi:hypothetical protein
MIVTFLLRKDWRTLFIKMWHKKKKDFNEQPTHALIAASTTPFPSLKTNPNREELVVDHWSLYSG